MTLQDIKQYIVKTPYNSNPNQIESMVAQSAAEQEAADEAARVPVGAVKNVEVPAYELKHENDVYYVDTIPTTNLPFRLFVIYDTTPTAPDDGLFCFISTDTTTYIGERNQILNYDITNEYWVLSEVENSENTPPAEVDDGNTVG